MFINVAKNLKFFIVGFLACFLFGLTSILTDAMPFIVSEQYEVSSIFLQTVWLYFYELRR